MMTTVPELESGPPCLAEHNAGHGATLSDPETGFDQQLSGRDPAGTDGAQVAAARRARGTRISRFGAKNYNRASVFVKFLINTFGLDALRAGGGVVDVAGGLGEVVCRLAYCHQTDCVLVEPRDDVRLAWCLETKVVSRLPIKWKSLWTPESGTAALEQHVTHLQLRFGQDALEDERLADALRGCALITGLHPDSAAEPIVDIALALGKAFAVVPCCVFPNSAPHRMHVRTHEAFCEFLQAKHVDIQRTRLAFDGRNDVLFYVPPCFHMTRSSAPR